MADNLGGFGTAETVGELRALLAGLPDEMKCLWSEDSFGCATIRVARVGVMTEEANARGLEDDPIAEQFITLGNAEA